MAKYSREEIRRRAKIFVEADKCNDPRAFMLLMKISIQTGLMPDAIKHRIYAIARG